MNHTTTVKESLAELQALEKQQIKGQQRDYVRFLRLLKSGECSSQAKAARLRAVRDQLGLQKSQVIAMGDGANDLAMMAEAGVSIAYHAKPVVREKATYSFNFCGLDALLNLYR